MNIYGTLIGEIIKSFFKNVIYWFISSFKIILE